MAPTSINLIAGSSHPELANRIAQRLGIESTPIEIVQYSNQERSIMIKDDIRDEDIFILQSTTAKVNDCLMELLQIVHACRAARAQCITAILPKYPYARQDKTSQGDGPMESRTAELVAIMLQAAGCNQVITLDLHNPEIEKFSTIPVQNLSAEAWMSDFIRAEIAFGSAIAGLDKVKEYIIVSPDTGGVPRAKTIADNLGLPLVKVLEERARPNEVASMSLVAGDDDDENVIISGKTAIIVHDMADTCRTLVKAADLLVEHGAFEIAAVVTHGIFSGGDAVKLLNGSAITTIFVTDSVPIPADWEEESSCNMMEIVDVSDLLADACLEVHRRGKGRENSPWASSMTDRRAGVAGAGRADSIAEYIWPVLFTLVLSAFYCWMLWMGLTWWFGHRLFLIQ